jgi:hypothetical protein
MILGRPLMNFDRESYARDNSGSNYAEIFHHAAGLVYHLKEIQVPSEGNET